MLFIYIVMIICLFDVVCVYDVVDVMMGGGFVGWIEFLWILIVCIVYDDVCMGCVNVMVYVLILLFIFFIWYFFRKLMDVCKYLGVF